MPLPDDEWAKGKCGLKGLQYMAMSIATVMSPVGVNTEIIQDGENGMLATETVEWVDKISRLIEDQGLRQKCGFNGRKTVEEKYSVKALQPIYLNYFKSLTEQKID
ncbi:MAG: glycosyltransferase [Bacteroidetes bacterium]|nr:glycosyltransferase [Bacteroidota bacterium]